MNPSGARAVCAYSLFESPASTTIVVVTIVVAILVIVVIHSSVESSSQCLRNASKRC